MRAGLTWYYAECGIESIRRTPVLTALMVLSISLGIAVCMAMGTLVHAVSGNPVIGSGQILYHVQLQNAVGGISSASSEPAEEVSWGDGMAILGNNHLQIPRTLLVGGQVIVLNGLPQARPFETAGLFTTADVFKMFRIPLIAGRPWSRSDDEMEARVAVISSKLAERLFGAEEAVGRTLVLGQSNFTIVGVIGHWSPGPHFYDTTRGAYSAAEDVFIPLAAAMATHQRVLAKLSCSGSWSGKDLRQAPCTWLNLWAQLADEAQRSAFANVLLDLKDRRLQGAPLYKLRNLEDWISFKQMVPQGLKMQRLIAIGFLLLCLFNAAILFVARSLKRKPELGLRRAIGASKTSIFCQVFWEAIIIGCLGGLMGTWLSVLGINILRADYPKYRELLSINMGILVVTFVLAICATILAALFPAINAARVAPSIVMKH